MIELPPCVIVFSGPPLTGKGWLAEEVASKLLVGHLDVDTIRQELFPNPELRILGNHRERFTMVMCYTELVKRALSYVEEERAVILTGTFSRAEFKAPLELLYNVLKEMEVPFYAFRMAIPSDQEVERRIAKRQVEGGPSNINTLERFKWSLDFFTPIAFAPVVVIDTERPVEECVDEVLGAVMLGI